MQYLTKTHKKYWDYHPDSYLPLSQMSDRTWWEILLGCRCQVARKFTYDGSVEWTVWVPDDEYLDAHRRLSSGRYSFMLERYSEQTVVLVEAGKQYFDEHDFQIKDQLEYRLPYDPEGDDLIDETWAVYFRKASPVRLRWEDEWHRVEITDVYKPFRSHEAMNGIVMHIMHELGKDVRVDHYVNGIYKYSSFNVWVYTSEEGCNPEGYVRRGYDKWTS